MKIESKYLEMFQALNTSHTGKTLIEYLEELMREICDARNWGEKDSKESAQHVATIIEKQLVDKIKLQHTKKVNKKDSFV